MDVGSPTFRIIIMLLSGDSANIIHIFCGLEMSNLYIQLARVHEEQLQVCFLEPNYKMIEDGLHEAKLRH